MTGMVEELFGFRPRSVVVFALGGGGDIVSAAGQAVWLEGRGVRVALAAIAWERFVVDPCPGPLRLEDFDSVEVEEGVVVAHGSCSAVRLCGCKGGVFVPQVCRVSRLLSRPVFIVDVWGGSSGISRSLERVASLTGAEAVLGVDVGGDVLGEGFEATLWSPLADSLGLAGMVDAGLPGVVAVQSPGADGELPIGYILERLSDLATVGGLKAARLLSRLEAGVIEGLVAGGAVTEASLLQILALRGTRGVVMLRGGARRAWLSPLQALIFYLDAAALARLSPLYRLASGTRSLEEAVARMNEAGVYTEYNLEEDMLREACSGSTPDPRRVRRAGRARLLASLRNAHHQDSAVIGS